MVKYWFQVFPLFLIINQIYSDECDILLDRKSIVGALACCQIPILFDDKWTETCASEIRDKQKISGIAKYKDPLTFFECIVKTGGGIVDNKPDAGEIKKQMKKILNEHPGWEKEFNAAVDKCVPEVIAKEEDTLKRISEPPYNYDKSINPIYGHLITCIGVHLYTECPVPPTVVPSECDTSKSLFKKCTNVFPPSFMKP